MPENNGSLSYRFKQIHDSAEAQINRVLLKHDLTLSQLGVLAVLLRAQGPMSLGEIEKAMGLARPTVIGLIRRLEGKGFVENRPCPQDRRRRSIALTEKALSHRQHMLVCERALDERLVAGMDGQQVQKLMELLDMVYANIKPIAGEKHSC